MPIFLRAFTRMKTTGIDIMSIEETPESQLASDGLQSQSPEHKGSWVRIVVYLVLVAALGLIVVSIIFQFAMGPIFTYAMIALACGYILYHTSNVMLHYRIGQHVAASLALFASVALLFWYILQLFLSRRN